MADSLCQECKDWGDTVTDPLLLSVPCPTCKRRTFPNLGVNLPAGAACALSSSQAMMWAASMSPSPWSAEATAFGDDAIRIMHLYSFEQIVAALASGRFVRFGDFTIIGFCDDFLLARDRFDIECKFDRAGHLHYAPSSLRQRLRS